MVRAPHLTQTKRRGSRSARAAGGADWLPYRGYFIGWSSKFGRWLVIQSGVKHGEFDDEQDAKKFVNALLAKQRSP